MKRLALLLTVIASLTTLAWNPRVPPQTIRFDSVPATWNPDGGTLGMLSNAEAVTFVSDMFAVWEAVPTTALSYTQGPQIVDGTGTPVDVDATNYSEVVSLGNGQNPIVFDNQREIFDLLGLSRTVAGFSSIRFSGNSITKSIIIMQGDFFDGEPVDTPPNDPGEIPLSVFFAVGVHEAGHFAGLGHSTLNKGIAGINGCPVPLADTWVTMNPTIGPDSASLHWDDEVGISALYPTTAFSDLPVIGGHLIDLDGTTPFDGGNMILRLDTTDCDAIYQTAQATQSGSNPDEYGGAGSYQFPGLTADTNYTVRATTITDVGRYPIGGTNPPALGGPDDSYNGASEDSFNPPDMPDEETLVVSGSTGIDVKINNSGFPGMLGSSLTVNRLPGNVGLDPQTLQNDDGAANSAFRLEGNAQLAWISRFTPAAEILPFQIERLDAIFFAGIGLGGRAVRLLVYLDADATGDPANATLVHTQDTTIAEPPNSSTFQEFTLDSPVLVQQGEFYVGFFDLVTPVNFVATFDADTQEGRSYVQANSTDPSGFTVCEDGASICGADRTWMIRTFGRTVPSAGTIELNWGDSCNAATLPGQDFAIYQGTLALVAGNTDLAPLVCTTGTSNTFVITDEPTADLYWLVTPTLATREGSLAPRTPASNCVIVGPDSCP